jgi:hypothetical protein
MKRFAVVIEAYSAVYTSVTVEATSEGEAEAAAVEKSKDLPIDVWQLTCPIPGRALDGGVEVPLALETFFAEGVSEDSEALEHPEKSSLHRFHAP